MWKSDVARPRDMTHCRYCRKELREGKSVIRSTRPVNARAPFRYRVRVAHAECENLRAAEAIAKHHASTTQKARR